MAGARSRAEGLGSVPKRKRIAVSKRHQYHLMHESRQHEDVQGVEKQYVLSN